MEFCVYEGLKALSTCVKASYLWRGITPLHHSFILHHCFTSFMQQFGVEVQRKRHHQRRNSIKLLRLPGAGLEVAGVASSNVAVVIAHFCGSEYFGLLGCILLLTTELYWGEKRDVSLSSLPGSLRVVVLFFSSVSPCLKGTSEEVHGHSTTRVSKNNWVAEQSNSVVCLDLDLF